MPQIVLRNVNRLHLGHGGSRRRSVLRRHALTLQGLPPVKPAAQGPGSCGLPGLGPRHGVAVACLSIGYHACAQAGLNLLHGINAPGRYALLLRHLFWLSRSPPLPNCGVTGTLTATPLAIKDVGSDFDSQWWMQ